MIDALKSMAAAYNKTHFVPFGAGRKNFFIYGIARRGRPISYVGRTAEPILREQQHRQRGYSRFVILDVVGRLEWEAENAWIEALLNRGFDLSNKSQRNSRGGSTAKRILTKLGGRRA